MKESVIVTTRYGHNMRSTRYDTATGPSYATHVGYIVRKCCEASVLRKQYYNRFLLVIVKVYSQLRSQRTKNIVYL